MTYLHPFLDEDAFLALLLQPSNEDIVHAVLYGIFVNYAKWKVLVGD